MANVELKSAALPLVLSVDVGTSSTKVLVYDCLGRQISGLEVKALYDAVATPDDGATFDLDRLFHIVVDAIDTVLSRGSLESGSIAAVSFSALWHSLVGLDLAGGPLTRVSTWADTAASPAVRTLRRRLDERAVHFRTGCRFHASYWPAKLVWFRKTHPALFRSVAHWVSLPDALSLRFTGALRTGISIASGTGMFDGRVPGWDAELLAATGLREEQVPAVVDGAEGALAALPEWRERWPALSQALWLPAVGDGACGSAGSGCLRPDLAALMIGTSGAIRWILPDSGQDVPFGLFRYRLDRKRIVVGGALSAGGNVHAWLREILEGGASPGFDERVAALPPNGHGLAVLPFFSGDRSPTWRPDAKAVIAGMTLKTTAEEIAQASCESVAYRFAMIDELAAGLTGDFEIIGSGGALGSSLVWSRIIADVLQRPIHLSNEDETSSRGAALLALVALGLMKSLDDAPAEIGETMMPRPEYREIYREGLREHRRLAKRFAVSPEHATIRV